MIVINHSLSYQLGQCRLQPSSITSHPLKLPSATPASLPTLPLSSTFLVPLLYYLPLKWSFDSHLNKIAEKIPNSISVLFLPPADSGGVSTGRPECRPLKLRVHWRLYRPRDPPLLPSQRKDLPGVSDFMPEDQLCHQCLGAFFLTEPMQWSIPSFVLFFEVRFAVRYISILLISQGLHPRHGTHLVRLLICIVI